MRWSRDGRGTMRALRLSLAPHRVLLAVTAGRFAPDLHRGATGSPLLLDEVPRPERPPGWVRVAPTLSGICGSDRKLTQVTGLGTAITALHGPPRSIIPGHEVVGIVTEAETDAPVRPGDRVVAEELLTCADKGLDLCARCRAGDDQACDQLARPGRLAPGHGFGHHARYGGGWAEELVAPADRVFRVPQGLDDRVAVLAEPTAVAVHAVGRAGLHAGDRVLVIGPGAIGLLLMHALAVLAPGVEVTAAAIDTASDRWAARAGAGTILHGTRADLVEQAAAHLGTPRHGNRLSGPLLATGFDVVFDTVGHEQTLDDALRMTRPRGRVVLVATSSRQRVDWTFVWSRELEVVGTAYFGTETVPDGLAIPGGRRRAMAVALDVLAERVPDLVTHVFPLDQPLPALRVSDAGPAASAVKVAFSPAVT